MEPALLSEVGLGAWPPIPRSYVCIGKGSRSGCELLASIGEERDGDGRQERGTKDRRKGGQTAA